MIANFKGKKAVVALTMETPTDIYNTIYNDPVENAFINVTLKTCGIDTVKYFQIDKLSSSGREYATKKFNEVLDYFN